MQKNKETVKLNTDLEKLKSVLYEISAQKEKLEKENRELNNKIIKSETNGISMGQKGELNYFLNLSLLFFLILLFLLLCCTVVSIRIIIAN